MWQNWRKGEGQNEDRGKRVISVNGGKRRWGKGGRGRGKVRREGGDPIHLLIFLGHLYAAGEGKGRRMQRGGRGEGCNKEGGDKGATGWEGRRVLRLLIMF
jgi:hypothetical protein